MTMIGKSPPRPDGQAKVRGSARYADDFVLPGMLFGATVRSPHARAELVRLHLDEVPANGAFVTARDLPGPNGVMLLNDDWPILADGEVRHVGEPVALVAAETRTDARLAAARVQADYNPLEAQLDYRNSAVEVISEFDLAKGDAAAMLSGADQIIEGEYTCGHQEHIYIEPQTMTAWYEDDGAVVVAGSMQCPYYVHKSLAHALGLSPDRVRVKATVVGGGFGGKEDYPSMIAIHAALLARATNRPVRMVYDRQEDIVGTTKRHPARIKHRTVVGDDGTLSALEIDILMDGGAYTTLSPVVLSRALLHASGPYRCENVTIKAKAVRTNTATNGAFRGFGAPQVQFAMERQMDRIARAVGVDPLEIRRRNALRAGDQLPTGQILDKTTSAHECLERVAELTNFADLWAANEDQAVPDGQSIRGVGLSLYFHGAGFTGNGERRMRSPIKARLTEGGRIEILTAMTDMGQGCVAIFPQMAQSAAGLAAEDFVFPEPDTARVPDSGPTVASRTTMVVGGLISRISCEMRDAVLNWWRGQEDWDGEISVTEGALTMGDRPSVSFREIAQQCFADVGDLERTIRHEPPPAQVFDEDSYQGAAYPTYAWAAGVVEVKVDPDTFEVRPNRATVVVDVGKAIHPTLCKGQIEGGTLQALGYGLLEEIKVEEGRYLNDRLATYIIPTFKDCPRIDVELVESDWAEGPFGAKGIGELPMDGGAPAAVSAIENAIGVSIDEIPATPERIFAATAREKIEPGSDS